MIRISKLFKNYGDKPILNDLSLELDNGTAYGLMGKNGAGKTTLLQCLCRLTPYQGHIYIDSDKVGYLPESPFFYSKMKGIEYLEFCLVARKQRIDQRLVQHYAQLFELPLNQYANTYSTGMRKKLAMLALLLQDNDVLLLDEPFNGLDLSSSIVLKRILQHLSQQEKTLLVSSHIISSLVDTCPTILFMKDGGIQQSFSNMLASEIELEITTKEMVDELEMVDSIFRMNP